MRRWPSCVPTEPRLRHTCEPTRASRVSDEFAGTARRYVPSLARGEPPGALAAVDGCVGARRITQVRWVCRDEKPDVRNLGYVSSCGGSRVSCPACDGSMATSPETPVGRDPLTRDDVVAVARSGIRAHL